MIHFLICFFIFFYIFNSHSSHWSYDPRTFAPVSCSYNVSISNTRMEAPFACCCLDDPILVAVSLSSTSCLPSASCSSQVEPSKAHLPRLSYILCFWRVLISKACLPRLSPVLRFWRVLICNASLPHLPSVLSRWCAVLIRSCCAKLSHAY